MTRSVRRGVADDLNRLIEVARRRRERYAEYEPLFWRPADDAVDRQRAFFRGLLDDPGAGIFVALEDDRVAGFVVASIVSNPPVYDPGGRTCLVDDFTVADDDDWSWAGPLLLDQVKRWAALGNAVQIVVVTGHLDEAKRAVLGRAGLSLASEWWTGPT